LFVLSNKLASCLQSFPKLGGGDNSSLWLSFAQQKAKKIAGKLSVRTVHLMSSKRGAGKKIGGKKIGANFFSAFFHFSSPKGKGASPSQTEATSGPNPSDLELL
jgi:hypothetical protein